MPKNGEHTASETSQSDLITTVSLTARAECEVFYPERLCWREVTGRLVCPRRIHFDGLSASRTSNPLLVQVKSLADLHMQATRLDLLNELLKHQCPELGGTSHSANNLAV